MCTVINVDTKPIDPQLVAKNNEATDNIKVFFILFVLKLATNLTK